MVHRFDDSSAAVLGLAARIAALAESVGAQGREFRIGLSGGSTPVPLYRLLAGARWAPRIDWARVRVLFADERGVPPDHPDSNYRLVRETLLDPLRVPEANVDRMRGEDQDLEAAAHAYEPCLGRPLDLLLLGIGDDGHTASIFPGSPAVHERSRRVLAVLDSPKPPPRRLTVTPRTIGEARVTAVLVLGSSKALVVASALGEGSPESLPARLLRGCEWYLDAGAAARLGPE